MTATNTHITGTYKTDSDLNEFRASQWKLNGVVFQMLNEANDEIEELKKRQKDNVRAMIELLVGFAIVFLGEMAIMFGYIF
ncbi:hypothetical protein [Weissella confusa]|uniref:Uncharacterized protein n=1 Tax=Weissella confusa TaxID=1583 RepID=A0A4Z0S137_WEICO|nr:hypothetical protein [Weissella confusa]TGE74958.1 hypothetical protein C6P11_02505 [Weissella confusa]